MKNYTTTLIFLFLFFSTQISYATVHTVINNDDNGSGALRFLIGNSVPADTIAFSPTIDGTPIMLTSGEIEIPHDLVILGNGINNTIISGNDNSRIFHVIAGTFEMQHVTIRDGLASGAGQNGSGGGVFCDGNTQNTIKNARFVNNNADNSGAIEIYTVNATITSCIFAGNKAEFSGGAIGVNQSNATLINSLVSGNVSANVGGTGQGGAAEVSNGSTLTIVSSTVVNNYAIVAGAGINGNYNVSNAIIWGNFNASSNNYDQINGTVNSEYSLIQGELLSGSGNIDGTDPNITPNFVAPVPASSTPSAAGDYRLKCTSPLIDLGNNLPYTTDLNGNPRTVDGLNSGTPTIDLGCYENQYQGPDFSSTLFEYCINNGPVSLNNLVTIPNGNFNGPGVQNNVFHPSVAGVGTYTITYSLTNASGCTRQANTNIAVLPKPDVQLDITNASCTGGDGAVNATITSGTGYDVYWSTGSGNEDLVDLNPGVYYITVTDDNGCQSTKMANVSSDAFTISESISHVSCYGGSDGNIDITINGSTGPYTVEWLNNGSNAEDATNIVAGTWEVYVEDANGCAVSEVYEVSEPDDITWTASTIEASCGSSDGSAQCLVTGGTAPYDFQWFDDTGSQVGTNDDQLTGITAGEYFVIISDANGCSKVWNTVVTETGGPQVTLDTVIHASCAGDGAIDISINSGNPIISTTWNSGETTEDLSNLSPGYYAVEVVDNAGCTGMLGVDVTNSAPATPEICLVTVDTNTITNQVVWEKPTTTSISHYNIYRETSTAGQYQFVDSVLYANESWFTDTVAYPHIRSWRYKISAVNTCDVESDLSVSHKTIHVTKNLALGGGVNVSWDHYEGFSYPTYFVMRHTDINGWEQIAALSSSSSTSYNDNPPSTNQLDYFISIEPPSTCVSQKATSHNASRSNRSQGIAGPHGGGNTDGLNIEEVKEATLTVFPNPTSDFVNVQWSQEPGKAVYNIFDASGKTIKSWQSSDQREIIDLKRYENGLYIITVEGETIKNQYRIVKQ